jgi:GntR family transcriptional regulator, transcriptional repressor for pyruvate dehydrogenase complex
VVNQLEELIFQNFEPGGRLPSENDLAKQLGVSRLTLREATRSLQARGLVTITKGRRPIVSHPTSGPVQEFFAYAIRRDPRRLLDLLEVRRALEVHAANLAATRARRGSLAAMESAIDAMRLAGGVSSAFNEADIRFHECLAEATGNQILIFLVEALAEPLRESRIRSFEGHLAQGLGVEAVIDQHRAILAAIERHNGEEAASAMKAHLQTTERDLRASLMLGREG